MFVHCRARVARVGPSCQRSRARRSKVTYPLSEWPWDGVCARWALVFSAQRSHSACRSAKTA
eukprot:15517446-Heterocapsa_arctica.AAC.1